MVALAVATWLPDSPSARAVRYLALSWMLLDYALRLRAGYFRRRPHWTRESWRRYFAVCAIPAGAILMLVGMALAIDRRLPMMGPSPSTVRGLWVVLMLVLMLIAGFGLWFITSRLTDGEPSRQFEWPGKRHSGGIS